MQKNKLGFLPLYIKLYDDTCPELRPKLETFYERMAAALEERGLEVIRTPFCRIEAEFQKAVAEYEAQNAACIVTLHMAYSPSLESAQTLLQTELPIVVLDTTMTYAFGPDQDPDEIDYNHGIHGVMDFCNLLKRGGKPYAVAAGHWEQSDVLAQTVRYVRAAAAARAVRGSRVGVFGGSFSGMGDFQVTPQELAERFGAELIEASSDEMREYTRSVTEEEIEAEICADRERFRFPEPIEDGVYRANTRACLAIRKWIEAQKLDAFTVNFLKACPAYGIDTMPFLEACKAMTRGIGYAGEGDALDAMLAGVLIRTFETASFVEIFCPDWKDDRLFLSHMGEMNYRTAGGIPEIHMRKSNYTDSVMPMAGYACYRPGKAVYANVYRDETGFCLLASAVEMQQITDDKNFDSVIRGWMKPRIPVKDFLRKLSEHGATHHSLLIYDAEPEQLLYFASLLHMKGYVI